MAERLHRTQILLEPQQHQALAILARREGRSISDLVREIIERELSQREQEAQVTLQRQLAALERIRQQRDAMLARRGGRPVDIDVVEMIRQMREERDERNIAGRTNNRD